MRSQKLGRVAARFCVLAAASVLGLGASACGGAGGAPPRRILETLDVGWSVEEVTVRRGEVRVAGTVEVDPAANDLDVVQSRCRGRSLGRGLWTRNRLVWTLSAREVASAVQCQMTIVARREAGSLEGLTFQPMISAQLNVGFTFEGETTVSTGGFRTEGSEAIVELRGDGASNARLSGGGMMLGPSDSDEKSATFRIPMEDMVALVLRGGVLRARGVGDGEVTVVAMLMVDGQEVKLPEEPVTEETPES